MPLGSWGLFGELPLPPRPTQSGCMLGAWECRKETADQEGSWDV